MKKSTLVIILSALIAVMGIVLAIVLGMVLTDIIDTDRNTLVISSASVVGIYNGEPLTDSGWTLHSGTLRDGHTLHVTVEGSQTEVGICQNSISVKIENSEGEDVTKQYQLVLKPGTLNVKHRAIGVIAESDIKMYDGMALVADEYSLDSTIALVDGHTLDVTVVGSITAVGVANSRVVAVSIYNADGVDVTNNYNVRKIEGTLRVYSEDALVFTSDNASKVYDGNVLSDDDWHMISGTLRDGDVAVVSVKSKLIDVGACDNEISVRIEDSNGNNVSGNYDIVCFPGRLTVLKAEMVITTASATKTFDDIPLVNMNYTVSPEGVLANGLQLNPIFTGIQMNVGSSKNTIEVGKIYDVNGRDVTHNYNITVVEGTLTVLIAPD